MRHVLVDHARTRRASKRGGEVRIEQLDEGVDFGVARAAEMIALDDALTSLAGQYPRQAEVVELRYFGGLSVEETAATLKLSPETVARDWRFAKAFLRSELQSGVKIETRWRESNRIVLFSVMPPEARHRLAEIFALRVSFLLSTGPSTSTANVPVSPSCAGRLRNFSRTAKPRTISWSVRLGTASPPQPTALKVVFPSLCLTVTSRGITAARLVPRGSSAELERPDWRSGQEIVVGRL